jgi:N-ethylmaleimide reductase
MSVETLFEPLRLGAIILRNRIVIAPMTRMRAGMIVTEGTAVSPQAQGFPNAPGIYTTGQIASGARSRKLSTRAAARF